MPSKRNAAGPASPATPAKSQTSSTNAISTPKTPSNTSTSTSKSSRSSAAKSQDPLEIINSIVQRYTDETPQRVKIIDTFLGFLATLGAIQFLYCIVAGNYPFNAFLSGFSATVGQFVLTASLRMQTNPENKKGNFDAISDERAFADFVLGSLILHLFCINFIN